MNKFAEKERAITLRKQGLSYNEVLAEVKVAKSTLSLWLREFGLSKIQVQRLTEKRLAAMQRGWEKVHQLRMERWRIVKEAAASEVKNINKRDRWLIGTALYWAEGTKEREWGKSTPIKFSNSDVRMLLFFQKWVAEFFAADKDMLVYELYIHENADPKKTLKYWSKKLNVAIDRFRVYLKRHNPTTVRKNTGDDYYGLIRIMVPGNVTFTRRIEGWVDGIIKNCRVV